MRIYNLKIDRLRPSLLDFKHIPKKAKLPEIVDLSTSSKMPPVFNQGNLGSCTAQAFTAVYHFIKPGFLGSRLFLYYNERMLENDIANDSGATLYSGVVCLKKYGVCVESLYAYIIADFAKPPSAAIYKAALANRLVKAQNLPNSIASIQNALASGFPIVIGIAIYSEFESAIVTKTGVVPMPRASSKFLGGHAVVVVGYDNRTKLFKVRNSWGAGWGVKGYFFLPYQYLQRSNLSSDLWVLSLVT
jgi:C1A family cysteine protease